MRLNLVVAAGAFLLGAAAPLAVPHAGQPEVLPVCPTQQTALLAAQGGSVLPDGCHVVIVTHKETLDGPVCQLDFSPNLKGLPGAIARMMRVPVRWWIACAYLRI